LAQAAVVEALSLQGPQVLEEKILVQEVLAQTHIVHGQQLLAREILAIMQAVAAVVAVMVAMVRLEVSAAEETEQTEAKLVVSLELQILAVVADLAVLDQLALLRVMAETAALELLL
jgi:hypothetical protein